MSMVSRGTGWPIAVAVILGTTVAVNIAVMRIAGSDPAFAIEPDYYRRAVHFDSTMAEARASLALGWRVDAHVGGIAASGDHTLTVRLERADGGAVIADSVRVTARYVARANDSLALRLSPGDTPGEFVAPFAARHAGQWELRVRAWRSDDRYSTLTRVEVPAASWSNPDTAR